MKFQRVNFLVLEIVTSGNFVILQHDDRLRTCICYETCSSLLNYSHVYFSILFSLKYLIFISIKIMMYCIKFQESNYFIIYLFDFSAK